MFKSIHALITGIFLLALSVGAVPVSPQGVVLQGTILTPTGPPEEGASVTFTIQIRSNEINDCLLYSEGHTLNMTNSGGAFSLAMGSGTRSGTGFQATSTLAQVFNNSAAMITPLTCSSGTSYTPASGDSRKVVISFDDGSGPQTLTQNLAVQAVPYALYADTLEGKSSADFVQVNTSSGKVLSQANLETVFGSSANMTELMALINGTSASFGGGSSATYTGSVTANGGIFGSSAASGNLTIDSTSNATKGNILLAPSGGNVGIGTSTPAYPLTIAGSTIGLGTGLLSMSTFGVSYGNGNNLGTILPSSVVMGSGNTADIGSVAIGRNNTTVLGIASEAVAVGLGNSVPRDSATAIGKNNWVGGTGYFALVAGYSNSVTGTNGVAVGYSNSATADGASAFGQSITNSIANSTMIGPSDAAKVTILSSGNVGIGTNSPLSVLHVSQNQNSGTIIRAENPNAGSNAEADFTLFNNLGSIGGLVAGSSTYSLTHFASRLAVVADAANSPGVDIVAAKSTGDVRIYSGGTLTTNERIRVLANGNVGIGTTSPSTQLHVKLPSGQVNSIFESNCSGCGSYINVFNAASIVGNSNAGIMFSTASSANVYGAIYGIPVNVSNGVLNFSTNTGGALTEKMRIDQNGYVGIGSTSPTATLDVTGSAGIVYRRSGASSAIALTDYSGSQPTITMNGTDSSVPNNLATAGAFRIYSGSTNIASVNAKLAIATDTAGNVGIGTTAPQTKLDVNGTVRVAKYSAQPFACDAAHDSTLAITSLYRQCICNGGTSTWVFTSDGVTTCAWM